MYYSLSNETLDELERLFITMAGFYLNHEKRTRYGRERFCKKGCGGSRTHSQNGGPTADRCGVGLAGATAENVPCMVSSGAKPQMAKTVQIGPNMAETQEAQK